MATSNRIKAEKKKNTFLPTYSVSTLYKFLKFFADGLS